MGTTSTITYLQIISILNGLAPILWGAGVAAQYIGVAFFGLMRKIAQTLNVVPNGQLFLFTKQAGIPPFNCQQYAKKRAFSCTADACNKFELPAFWTVRKVANGVQ